jgi:hypothetical protein
LDAAPRIIYAITEINPISIDLFQKSKSIAFNVLTLGFNIKPFLPTKQAQITLPHTLYILNDSDLRSVSVNVVLIAGVIVCLFLYHKDNSRRITNQIKVQLF